MSNFDFNNFTQTYQVPEGASKWIHTSMVEHKGKVIALAMDDARRIYYVVLDNTKPNADSVDARNWSPKPSLLSFPSELAKVGYAEADQVLFPIIDKDGYEAAPGAWLEEKDIDRYKSSTARLTAPVAFQVWSDQRHIYLFRQSIKADDPNMTFITQSGEASTQEKVNIGDVKKVVDLDSHIQLQLKEGTLYPLRKGQQLIFGGHNELHGIVKEDCPAGTEEIYLESIEADSVSEGMKVQLQRKLKVGIVSSFNASTGVISLKSNSLVDLEEGEIIQMDNGVAAEVMSYSDVGGHFNILVSIDPDNPPQIVANSAIHLMWQPLVDSTLLADRFVMVQTTVPGAGTIDQLAPCREVRYRRSRSKAHPQSRKDNLGAMDMDEQAFFEPTLELEFIQNLESGAFSVSQIPTAVSDVKRWQIFAFNTISKRIDSYNLGRSKDGLFDTRGVQFYTSPDPEYRDSVFEREPGIDSFTGKPLIPVEQSLEYGGSALNLGATNAGGAGTTAMKKAPLSKSGSYTVEMWVCQNWRHYSGMTYNFAKFDSYTMGFYATSSDTLQLEINSFKSVQKYPVKKWIQLALSYDQRSKMNHIYINGKIVHSESNPTGISNFGTDQLSIGALLGIGSYQNMLVDDVRLWSYCRSAEDIADQYKNRLIGNEPGLRLYWRMDANSSKTLYDLTDYQNNATFSGSIARWEESTAPIGPHPGIIRDSFLLTHQANTLDAPGLSSLLYFQQEDAVAGHGPVKKPLKRQARLMLAISNILKNGSLTNGLPVNILDFGIDRGGRLTQTPTVVGDTILPKLSTSANSYVQMPVIHTDAQGLTLNGCILSNVTTMLPANLYESALGHIALYYQEHTAIADTDHLSVVYFDTKTGRSKYALPTGYDEFIENAIIKGTAGDYYLDFYRTPAISLDKAGLTLSFDQHKLITREALKPNQYNLKVTVEAGYSPNVRNYDYRPVYLLDASNQGLDDFEAQHMQVIARAASPEYNDLDISVKANVNGEGFCDLLIEPAGNGLRDAEMGKLISEQWKRLPRQASQMASILNGDPQEAVEIGQLKDLNFSGNQITLKKGLSKDLYAGDTLEILGQKLTVKTAISASEEDVTVSLDEAPKVIAQKGAFVQKVSTQTFAPSPNGVGFIQEASSMDADGALALIEPLSTILHQTSKIHVEAYNCFSWMPVYVDTLTITDTVNAGARNFKVNSNISKAAKVNSPVYWLSIKDGQVVRTKIGTLSAAATAQHLSTAGTSISFKYAPQSKPPVAIPTGLTAHKDVLMINGMGFTLTEGHNVATLSSASSLTVDRIPMPMVFNFTELSGSVKLFQGALPEITEKSLVGQLTQDILAGDTSISIKVLDERITLNANDTLLVDALKMSYKSQTGTWAEDQVLSLTTSVPTLADGKNLPVYRLAYDYAQNAKLDFSGMIKDSYTSPPFTQNLKKVFMSEGGTSYAIGTNGPLVYQGGKWTVFGGYSANSLKVVAPDPGGTKKFFTKALTVVDIWANADSSRIYVAGNISLTAAESKAPGNYGGILVYENAKWTQIYPVVAATLATAKASDPRGFNSISGNRNGNQVIAVGGKGNAQQLDYDTNGKLTITNDYVGDINANNLKVIFSGPQDIPFLINPTKVIKYHNSSNWFQDNYTFTNIQDIASDQKEGIIAFADLNNGHGELYVRHEAETKVRITNITTNVQTSLGVSALPPIKSVFVQDSDSIYAACTNGKLIQFNAKGDASYLNVTNSTQLNSISGNDAGRIIIGGNSGTFIHNVLEGGFLPVPKRSMYFNFIPPRSNAYVSLHDRVSFALPIQKAPEEGGWKLAASNIKGMASSNTIELPDTIKLDNQITLESWVNISKMESSFEPTSIGLGGIGAKQAVAMLSASDRYTVFNNSGSGWTAPFSRMSDHPQLFSHGENAYIYDQNLLRYNKTNSAWEAITLPQSIKTSGSPPALIDLKDARLKFIGEHANELKIVLQKDRYSYFLLETTISGGVVSKSWSLVGSINLYQNHNWGDFEFGWMFNSEVYGIEKDGSRILLFDGAFHNKREYYTTYDSNRDSHYHIEDVKENYQLQNISWPANTKSLLGGISNSSPEFHLYDIWGPVDAFSANLSKMLMAGTMRGHSTNKIDGYTNEAKYYGLILCQDGNGNIAPVLDSTNPNSLNVGSFPDVIFQSIFCVGNTAYVAGTKVTVQKAAGRNPQKPLVVQCTGIVVELAYQSSSKSWRLVKQYTDADFAGHVFDRISGSTDGSQLYLSSRLVSPGSIPIDAAGPKRTGDPNYSLNPVDIVHAKGTQHIWSYESNAFKPIKISTLLSNIKTQAGIPAFSPIISNKAEIVAGKGLELGVAEYIGKEKWTQLTTGTEEQIADFYRHADTGTLYAACGGGIIMESTDGTTWATKRTQQASQGVACITGNGSSVYAAGYKYAWGKSQSTDQNPMILELPSGGSWTDVTVDKPKGLKDFSFVSGIYASGNNTYAILDKAWVIQITGSSFTKLKDIENFTSYHRYPGDTSHIYVKYATDVYAYNDGTHDQVFASYLVSDHEGYVWHLQNDGSSNWNGMAFNTGIHAIWGNKNTLFAVGKEGSIYYADISTAKLGQVNEESAWTKVSSFPKLKHTLRKVFGNGDYIYAVGDYGTILYCKTTDYTTWYKLDYPDSNHLHAIWFDSKAANIYVGGDQGKIYQYTPAKVASDQKKYYRLTSAVGKSKIRAVLPVLNTRPSTGTDWHHIATSYRQAYGLDFNTAKGAYLDVGKAEDLNIAQDLSLEITVQLPKTAPKQFQGLISKGQKGDGLPYQLYLNPNGQLCFDFEIEADENSTPLAHHFQTSFSLYDLLDKDSKTLPDGYKGLQSLILTNSSHRILKLGVARKMVRGLTDPQDSGSFAEGVIVDFFINGNVIKFDIQNSKRLYRNEDDSSGQVCKILSDEIAINKKALEIGRVQSDGTWYYFNGVLLEARIWNVALGASAVGKSLTGREKGLVGCWLLSEGNGFVTADLMQQNTARIHHARWMDHPDPYGSVHKIYMDGKALWTEPGISDKILTDLSLNLDEVRIWEQLRRTEEIADNQFAKLMGPQMGLAAMYTFNNTGQSGEDSSGRQHPLEEDPKVVASTAPISIEMPQVGYLGKANVSTPIVSRPGNGEYADIQFGLDGSFKGVMKRAYSYISDPQVWTLLTGSIVGSLMREWVSQVQADPQVVGFIEGAPPVPSENLTSTGLVHGEVADYGGASSVQLSETDNVNYQFSDSENIAKDKSFSLKSGIGTALDIKAGLGLEVETLELDLAYSFKHKDDTKTANTDGTQRSFGKNNSRVSKLKLGGTWEINNPAMYGSPAMGRRFQPSNFGYALVKSDTMDVYALRLEQNHALVSYQLEPNPDIPKDTNIIIFEMNPRYTKQGTLDGKIGFKADGTVQCDPDFPNAAEYGPHSYFKPREAYRFKRQIERERERLKAYHTAYNTKASEDRNDQNLKDKTFNTSIVNTYVWTARGGFFAESTENLDAIIESSSGNYSTTSEDTHDLSIELKTGVNFKFELEWIDSQSTEVVKTASSDESQSFSVDVECATDGDLQIYVQNEEERARYAPYINEGGGAYTPDGKAIPRPGKVDAYRFMTFFLEPSSDNFDDFFNKVVDPIWLAQSNDPSAVALRQANQGGKKPRCWRILHRVTFVSRILPEFEQASPMAKVAKKLNINSNWELINKISPFVDNHTADYLSFTRAVHAAVLQNMPEMAPHLSEITQYMCDYFGVHKD